jgi:hypothetical protein
MKYLSILTKKSTLTKFEQKVKNLAVQKGGKLPSIVEALAELDWNPARAEQMKQVYMDLMTSGKDADKTWAKRVVQIIKNVHQDLKSSTTASSESRIVSREFGYKKEPFVIISNQIDGFVAFDQFSTYKTKEEALAAWEEVKTAKKAGEWDVTLYECSPNSKVIEQYGYYLRMSSAKKLKEATYMMESFV